jgi:hypothetical protein
MLKLTLKELNKKYPYLLDEIADQTRQYSTLIIYDSNPDPNEPLGGSGTFAIIGSRKGILINEHVFRKIIKQDPGYVYIPNILPKLGTLPLRIVSTISLPENTLSGTGIDISFIELNDTGYESIINMGKQFWDLNLTMSEFLQDKFFVSPQNMHDYLWLVHSGAFEDRSQKETAKGEKFWWYPHACSDFIGPKKIDFSTCRYEDILDDFALDQISCFIDREGDAVLPRSFNGMSGSGVWRVSILDGKLNEIWLAGIATSEEYGRNFEIDTIDLF